MVQKALTWCGCWYILLLVTFHILTDPGEMAQRLFCLVIHTFKACNTCIK